ncbi:hypothetical protein [Sphingobium sp. YR768]|uniref:hypothetical protein n=1 Tax=Sphingobium sp. YR768 TaxID=1884365 RepID=UPI00116004E4|nr:hypothetical protein [Sphingobium sp. YR768]
MFDPIRRMKTIPERMRFKFYPRLAAWKLRRSTRRAQEIIGSSAPITILIDNSVLAHGVTHETKWIQTGTARWGSEIRGTGYAARVPVHSKHNDTWIYEQVQFLPGIAFLAETGLIKLFQSAELRSERDRQPAGLYRGYSYFDRSVFEAGSIPSVDGDVEEIMMGWSIKPRDWAKEQRERLARSGDTLFHALHERLKEQLGKKGDQDAWHIRTAEVHNIYCFLTMDKPLLSACNQLRKKIPLNTLKTKVMSPKEFSAAFGILPVSPQLLSYNDASWFVRADETMPGEKRRSRRDYE